MSIGKWLYLGLILTLLLLYNPRSKSAVTYNNLLPRPVLITNEFFPTENKQLIYESDFGDVSLKIENENQFNIFTLEGNNFLYRQKLLVNEQGVFVKEVFQKVRVLLVINQEESFSYSELFPRIKFPLKNGSGWNWEGKEIMEEETNTINLVAKVLGVEKINVPAGSFDAIRVQTKITSSSGSKSIVNEWYTKDIGLVKMTANLEGGGMIGTLRDLLGYGELVFELKNN